MDIGSVRRRTGGVAALAAAATFIFGFALFATMLSDYTTGDPTPGESVEFLVDNQAAFIIWNTVIFIVFGAVLVPLILTLYHELRDRSPLIAPIASVFGFIWVGLVLATGMVANIAIGTVSDLYDENSADVEPVWSALDSIQNGLGGGNEIVGGLWVLLISAAALRSGAFSKTLNYLGAVIGVAGLVTVIPQLELVGAVFGLGLIVWFVWLGVLLTKDSSRSPQSLETVDLTANRPQRREQPTSRLTQSG